MVQQLGDIIDVLREADLAHRAEVCQQLGLRLTYHPNEREVRVQRVCPRTHVGNVVSEGEPIYNPTGSMRGVCSCPEQDLGAAYMIVLRHELVLT